jgi:hypothetical protein
MKRQGIIGGPSTPARRLVLLAATALVALAAPTAASAAVTAVNPATGADTVANAFADGAADSGNSFDSYPTDAVPNYPAATGTAGSYAGFPTGGSDFALLSTGAANNPGDTAYSAQTGPSHGAADVTTLKVNFTVPGGANCLAFDYRFLTNDYFDNYDDGFIAELDGSDWAMAGDSTLSGSFDIAASDTWIANYYLPYPDAINEANASGTAFEAATPVITTKAPVDPGAHTLALSIFDAVDGGVDSAVLADHLRFSNESSSTCQPFVVVPPPDNGTPPPPSNVFTFGSFKGTTSKGSLKVTVPGPGLLTSGPASGAGAAVHGTAAKKKKKKQYVGKGKVTATGAGTFKLPVKLTSAGKKQLKKKHKLKVKVKVTFTPNGGTPASKTKTVTFKAKKKKKK